MNRRQFTTKNGRPQLVIGLERAADNCGVGRELVGVRCLDIISGNEWISDVKYFNPLPLLNYKGFKLVMALDWNMREADGSFKIV